MRENKIPYLCWHSQVVQGGRILLVGIWPFLSQLCEHEIEAEI